MTGTDQIDATPEPTTAVEGTNPEEREASKPARRTRDQVIEERRQALEARRAERKARREERDRARDEKRAARKIERESKKATRKGTTKTKTKTTSKSRSTKGRTKTESGRKRDPEGTKARIMAAATELFTKCGLNGTSLDDISKEAGVNRGLIYHYFKTKEFLFDQVLAKPLADYVQSHLEFLQHRDVDVDTLREATRGFFYFLQEHPEMVRIIAWTLAMRRFGSDLAQLQFTRALYERAVARIEEAKERGAIRESVNAQHLLITIIDLSVSWHLGRAEWIEKLSWQDRDLEELDEERLEAILDLVEAGIRPLPEVIEA